MKKALLLLFVCVLSLCSCVPKASDEEPTLESASADYSHFGLSSLLLQDVRTVFPKATGYFRQRPDPNYDRLNPLDGIDGLSDYLNAETNARSAYLSDFFPTDTYGYIKNADPYGFYAPNLSVFLFSLGVEIKDGVRSFGFLEENPFASILTFPCVDAICSNGAYSYVANLLYISQYPEKVEENRKVLYLVFHDDFFPYTVFYSQWQIFFISRDGRFDRKCVELLLKDKNVWLFKK
jgi:hypothetical protein